MSRSKQNKGGNKGGEKYRKETKQERRDRLKQQEEAREVCVSCVLCVLSCALFPHHIEIYIFLREDVSQSFFSLFFFKLKKN